MEEFDSIWCIPINHLKNSDISHLDFLYLVGTIPTKCDDYIPMIPLIVVHKYNGTICCDKTIWNNCMISDDWEYGEYIAKLVIYEEVSTIDPLVQYIGELRNCKTVCYWVLRKNLSNEMIICNDLVSKSQLGVYLIPTHINTDHKESTMYIENVINYIRETIMMDMVLFSDSDIIRYIEHTPINDIKESIDRNDYSAILTGNLNDC